MHKLFGRTIPLLCSLLMTIAVQAQDAKEQQIKTLIESKRFIFVAQQVLPLSQPVRVLTSDYDLKVKGDTLDVYLPYFGRAYSGVIGTTDQGLTFTSTKYDYEIKPTKKGGWTVTLKPRDQKVAQNMTLLVTQSGSASLQVNCRDRQSISFNGYIAELK